MADTYNGWTNYETWNVKLWIDNEYGDYCYWAETSRELLAESDGDVDNVRYVLSERLRDSMEDRAQDVLEAGGAQASMFADLLGAALSVVNWREIADSLLETALEATDGNR